MKLLKAIVTLFIVAFATALPQEQPGQGSTTTLTETLPPSTSSVIAFPFILSLAPSPVPASVVSFPVPVSSPGPALAPSPVPSMSGSSPSPSGTSTAQLADYGYWASSTGSCNCGDTYCSDILLGNGFTMSDLNTAYCIAMTNGTAEECAAYLAPTDVSEALYLCRCGGWAQELSSVIQLLCGCRGQCLNISPDYRGHCNFPCFSTA